MTLLTKVIAFHMRLSVVHVWEMDFQRFILRLLGGGGSLGLQNGFKNLLQVFLNILEDRGCSGRDDSDGKVCP